MDVQPNIYKVVPPKLCLLVYNPMKIVDISPTKTIVIGVINQLSYLGGTTLYIYTLYIYIYAYDTIGLEYGVRMGGTPSLWQLVSWAKLSSLGLGGP